MRSDAGSRPPNVARRRWTRQGGRTRASRPGLRRAAFRSSRRAMGRMVAVSCEYQRAPTAPRHGCSVGSPRRSSRASQARTRRTRGSLAALLFFGLARPPADTEAEAADGGATRGNEAATIERGANGPHAPLQAAASRAVRQASTAFNAAGASAPTDGSTASPSSPLRSPRERLHATWQREPLDPVWTAEAQELLSQSATAVHVDVTLREEISCRQSLCRAVLEVAQPSDLRTLSQVTWVDRPWASSCRARDIATRSTSPVARRS